MKNRESTFILAIRRDGTVHCLRLKYAARHWEEHSRNNNDYVWMASLLLIERSFQCFAARLAIINNGLSFLNESQRCTLICGSLLFNSSLIIAKTTKWGRTLFLRMSVVTTTIIRHPVHVYLNKIFLDICHYGTKHLWQCRNHSCL